jgi:hypothetical protein
MNQYKANISFTVRTISGQRIQIEAGKIYHGGFDFRDIQAGRSVIFVKVNGHNDEVHLSANDGFLEKFKFIGHVQKVEYMPVQIVKRPRIAK